MCRLCSWLKTTRSCFTSSTVSPSQNFVVPSIGVRQQNSKGACFTMYLSRPFGLSIDDHISKADHTLNLCSVDDANAILQRSERKAKIAKSDVEHASRLNSLHPKDWNLLDYFFDKEYDIVTVLSFGLWSSPCRFDQLSEVLERALNATRNFQTSSTKWMFFRMLVLVARQFVSTLYGFFSLWAYLWPSRKLRVHRQSSPIPEFYWNLLPASSASHLKGYFDPTDKFIVFLVGKTAVMRQVLSLTCKLRFTTICLRWAGIVCAQCLVQTIKPHVLVLA